MKCWRTEPNTRGDEIYLRQPIKGQYLDFTWNEVQEKVQQLAGALRHLGLEPGDKIAVLSKNCAEWFITDLALMHGGYISVPIYPTANPDTIRYVLQHSGAKAIVLGKLDHWADQEAGVGGELLRLAMPYDTMPAQYQWEQLLNMGNPLIEAPLPEPDQIMTLIYTSGSTGQPLKVRFKPMLAMVGLAKRWYAIYVQMVKIDYCPTYR